MEKNRMTTPSTSFITLAGKYFCSLAPQDITKEAAHGSEKGHEKGH